MPMILGIVCCCLLLSFVFYLRIENRKPDEPALTRAPEQGEALPTPEPKLTPEPTSMPDPFSAEQRARWTEDAEALRLSELMVKNAATLRDEDGDFSDWLELENCSGRTIDLAGWRLSDKKDGGEGWEFPDVRLKGGDRLIVFASGKDRSGDEMHTSFSLSADEWLSLRTPDGEVVFSFCIPAMEKDCSLAAGENGALDVCFWPTPGQPNDAAGYEAWQQSQLRSGPLVINEAMSANPYGVRSVAEGLDWVELRNISEESIELSGYYLSDDKDDYLLWQLPEATLRPGQRYLIVCDKDAKTEYPCAPFSLKAERETLYLSTATELCDYVSLHDIPFTGSCGRAEEGNGFCYYTRPTPGLPNVNGIRRVSVRPRASIAGGLYDNVDALTVSLDAPGPVYYTLDGSTPDESSRLYTEAIELKETAVLRAICMEEGALPSRCLTESYFINEGHSLPVASLVADQFPKFQMIYNLGATESEIPGCLALYEPDGSFQLGCGISISGATTLELPKKNVTVHFRGAYGASSLKYDLFDGGIDEFGSLAFRGGQDYYVAIIRNELMQNLALQFSPDHLVTQRSKYCVLYINGNYYGIYALKDKANRSHYAHWAGVSKDSVTSVRSPVPEYFPFYGEVYLFVMSHDMSDADNYAQFCELVDADSLIDWTILEGYCTNTDIASGNLKYFRSTEGDGKWRAVFYDLDITLRRDYNLFHNVLGPEEEVRMQQVTQILLQLLKNEQFRARFLERLSAALYGPLSDENVLAEIDRLYAGIESELPRDFARWNRDMYSFEEASANLRKIVTGHARQAYKDICDLLALSEQEKAQYFPDPIA